MRETVRHWWKINGDGKSRWKMSPDEVTCNLEHLMSSAVPAELATGHLFSICVWTRGCLDSQQRDHVLWAFFPQLWRLLLMGRVLKEALSASFIGSGGSPCTAFSHSSGELPSHCLAISPHEDRLHSCWCLLLAVVHAPTVQLVNLSWSLQQISCFNNCYFCWHVIAWCFVNWVQHVLQILLKWCTCSTVAPVHLHWHPQKREAIILNRGNVLAANQQIQAQQFPCGGLNAHGMTLCCFCLQMGPL